MRVRFWGTRGSVPTPGPGTVRYGGNTSCVEIRSAAGTVVVVDCGTGARELGNALVAASADDPTAAPASGAVLIGHTHWDHIHGLPFFAPLFVPHASWALYGPRGLGRSLADVLAGQMQYTYFPVSPDQLAADVTYHDLVEGVFVVGDVTIRAQYLNHPALTLGYRITADGRTVVYASDHEPFGGAAAAAGDDLDHPGDVRHVEFVRGADVLIHDAQYVAAEYEAKAGWGHGTMEYAVEVARRAGVAQLVLHHHDPTRDDDAVDGVLAAARRRVGASGASTQVDAAAEGTALELGTRAARRAEVTVDSATATPAIHELRPVLVVDVDDAEAGAVVRAAAAAEDLEELAESRARGDGGSTPVPVVAVRGVGDLATHGAPRTHPGATVTTIAVTRGAPVATGAAIDDWIVWPSSVAHVRTKLRAAILRHACRWQAAPVPADDGARVEALRALRILDTDPEPRFDRYTALACEELETPIALVTLVDGDRQWFKSRRGLDAVETHRDESLCAYAILGDEPFHVPDLLCDGRFADSPAVVGPDRIRAYLGVPLALPDGSRVGTLCVADHRPRLFDDAQVAALVRIARSVEAELTDRG